MNKKRMIAALAVTAILIAALVGCGNTAPTPGSAQTVPASGAVSPSGSPEEYDVGKFSLTLPEGWKAFPQNDVFGEADENGQYPIDDELIFVSKDAKTELDLLSEPYISFSYSAPETTVISSKDFYENVEDLDVTIPGLTVTEAYSGTSAFVNNAVWKYQVLTLSYEKGQISVTIPTVADNAETGLSWDTPEVMAMIQSVAIH